MTNIGLWSISQNSPSRITRSSVSLESQLEAWIELDPALLEHGLVIVGKQLPTDGGPLDLLAIDRQGRWVLIEIKRDRLRRDVISQAIDYASCLVKMQREQLAGRCDAYLQKRGNGDLRSIMADRGASLNESDSGREFIIYLVGTSVDPDLERMVEYLNANGGMQIRLISFSVYQDKNGDPILAREIHESTNTVVATPSRAEPRAANPDEEQLLRMADERGLGPVVRPIYEASVDVGFFPRCFSKSFMIAPPQHKGRCLIYLPFGNPGKVNGDKLKLQIASEPFEQFFDLPKASLAAAFGGSIRLDEDYACNAADAKIIADGLRKLFQERLAKTE